MLDASRTLAAWLAGVSPWTPRGALLVLGGSGTALGVTLHSSARSGAGAPTNAVRHATSSPAHAAHDTTASQPGGGAPQSFREVYDAHFDLVYRVARRTGVPESECDDAVQEIFLVLHRKLPEFEGRSSLRTFVYAIARRVARDQREKRAHRPLGGELVERELGADGVSPEALVAEREAARIVAAILQRMDPGRREVFELAELEGFTGAEIAESLGMNVNTVHSQLREARREFAATVARHRAQEAHRRHG